MRSKELSGITRNRISSLAQVRLLLKGVPKDSRAAVVCSLVGHSRIVEACFGYITCGRCDAQIADKLGGAGYAQAAECVQVGHNCKQCRSNFRKMTWRDKFMVKNPFTKERRRA